MAKNKSSKTPTTRAKPRARKAANKPDPIPTVTLDREQLDKLLDDLEHEVLEGLGAYQAIVGGVPYNFFKTVPQALGAILQKARIIRDVADKAVQP